MSLKAALRLFFFEDHCRLSSQAGKAGVGNSEAGRVRGMVFVSGEFKQGFVEVAVNRAVRLLVSNEKVSIVLANRLLLSDKMSTKLIQRK